MAAKGKAVLIAALALAMAGAPVLANSPDTRVVMPQGLELSDEDLREVEGAAAPTAPWLQQLQQACMATPMMAAGCSVALSVVGAIGYVLLEKTRKEIEREVSPAWERLITEPLTNCGPWGWKCW